MLVLSRKVNETIVVKVPPSTETRTITMVVVEVRGDKVRMGTEADRDISVHRGEVQDLVDKRLAGS